MQFGKFDDIKREYVIHQPETPLPWINYLGTKDYFGLISNTAGGYSFYKDARLRRLTRYRYNNAPLDINGRYIYIRDDEASRKENESVFWSPSWQPTQSKLDHYECRHGMSYTIISSRKNNIEASTRYFIPLEENLEIWDMTLRNLRQEKAVLSLYSAVEFNLWDAMDDSSNFQRNYSTGEVEVENGVIFHKTEYRERRNHFSFFASSEPISGFETQREAFLGAYNGWDNPLAVGMGKMSNSIAHGWQPIGSHQVKITLEPGEEKRVTFILGYMENHQDEKFDPPESNTINKTRIYPKLEKYLDPANIESSFQDLRANWDILLNKFQVETPDEHSNRMVNIWNAYQVMTTFNLSRSASYFESGIGRGMGFRDSNQDLLGFVHMLPGRSRERILDLASTQLSNGGAFHQYQPLTKRGNNDVGSDFNDDPLWLVLAVAAYLKETGDWTILNETVPYENQPGTEKSIYDHLQRALQYTLDRLGPNKLPLIGRADWNDCLNLNCFSEEPGQSFQTTTNTEGEVAESVFIAGLFCLAAKEMIQITKNYASEEKAEFYENSRDQIEKAIWKAGWDGAWFRRAYDAFGDPIGSAECDEGQIFIEPQGMCIMAGLGLDNGKAEKALDSVKEMLATPHGIVLLQPAFSKYQLRLGEISSYPPGYKENAGIFCHTNPWIIISECMAGRADQAFNYYQTINPSAREKISEVHRCEPYVYAQMIAGRDAATHGEAKNSWLTGTAAWNYVAITQWILGIRPEYDGLMINPNTPESWKTFSVSRKFRGVNYKIHFKRIGKGNQVQISINNKILDTNILPIPDT
nr:glycosyl transferase [Anaerolineaceae bacterium]